MTSCNPSSKHDAAPLSIEAKFMVMKQLFQCFVVFQNLTSAWTLCYAICSSFRFQLQIIWQTPSHDLNHLAALKFDEVKNRFRRHLSKRWRQL